MTAYLAKMRFSLPLPMKLIWPLVSLGLMRLRKPPLMTDQLAPTVLDWPLPMKIMPLGPAPLVLMRFFQPLPMKE